MCTVLLPLGVNPIAVDKYIIYTITMPFWLRMSFISHKMLTNSYFYSKWRHKQFVYPHVGLNRHSDGINSSNLFDQVFATLSGLHITCTASSSVKPNSYVPPLAVGIHLPPATSLYLKIMSIPTKKLPQWWKIHSLSTYDWSGTLLSWIASTNN
jgi:hypothetical protein